jgi:hypothetical protein
MGTMQFKQTACRAVLFGTGLSLLGLSVGACTEAESGSSSPESGIEEVSGVPFSIETRAAAPPDESLPRTTLAVLLDSGQTAELVFTTITPPEDSSSPPAGPEDTVTIRFAAGLNLGAKGVRVYDSTEKRNRDFSFSLADPGVIRGLREGIPGMRVGELRRFEIPWQLAYGEHGRGEIPPSTDLVFAVELISID